LAQTCCFPRPLSWIKGKRKDIGVKEERNKEDKRKSGRVGKKRREKVELGGICSVTLGGLDATEFIEVLTHLKNMYY